MKKILIVFIGLLIIVSGSLLIFFKYNLEKGDVITPPKDIGSILDNALGVLDCTLYPDLTVALESGDIKSCDCLDTESQADCKLTFLDNFFYDQAKKQLDSSFCDKIVKKEIKVACIEDTKVQLSTLTKDTPDTLLSTYLSADNYDKAITILENILKTEQKTSWYFNLLATTYAEKGLADHTEATYVPKALALIEKAKVLEPNNADVYRTEGYVYEIKPDLAKAIISYNKAISLNPDYILAYIGRSHTKDMQGDIDGALADLNKAASLDKNKKNVSIYVQLCRVNMFLNKIEDAVSNCAFVKDSVFASPVEKAAAHASLGFIYANQHEYDKALNLLKIGETYNPKDVSLMVVMADVLVKKGDYVLAETYSRKAVSLDSKKAQAYEYLAMSLMLQEKYSESEENALIALDLISGDASLLSNYKPIVLATTYRILTYDYAYMGDTVSEAKYGALIDSLKK